MLIADLSLVKHTLRIRLAQWTPAAFRQAGNVTVAQSVLQLAA
jgi:hypothetical protein